jgi:hypothetical protein
MANLPRLMSRQPRIDAAELELTRTRTIDRLSALGDPVAPAMGAELEPAMPIAEAAPDEAVGDPVEIKPQAPAPAPEGSTQEAVESPVVIQLPAWTAPSTPVTPNAKPSKAKSPTDRATAVTAAAEPGPGGAESPDPKAASSVKGGSGPAAVAPGPGPETIPASHELWPATRITDVAEGETTGPEPDPGVITPRPVVIGSRNRYTATPAGPIEPAKAPAPAPSFAPTESDPAPRVRPSPVRTARANASAGRRSVAPAKSKRSLRTATAFCPYCALFLVPPLESSRPCVRCQRQIVVKRVEGRLVYLTEAAIEVFEAERRRSADLERWSTERDQWLKEAVRFDPNAEGVDHLRSAPVSEDAVMGARNLYLALVDRRMLDLERDERWEDAANLGHAQAAIVNRLAGSPARPPDDVIAIHRRSAAAGLRWIGRVASEAALDAAGCCAICQVDDGRTFPIEAELETPRLPHDGCPNGLCRCRWDLTERDKVMLRRYLDRRGRPRP